METRTSPNKYKHANVDPPCTHCGETTLIDDYAAGDCVCTSCGTVQYGQPPYDCRLPYVNKDESGGGGASAQQWRTPHNPFFLNDAGGHMKRHSEAMRRMETALCIILRGDIPRKVLWRARELFEEQYRKQLDEMYRPQRIVELEKCVETWLEGIEYNPECKVAPKELKLARRALKHERTLPTRVNFSRQKQHIALSLFVALAESGRIDERTTPDMICRMIAGGADSSHAALMHTAAPYYKKATAPGSRVPPLARESLKRPIVDRRPRRKRSPIRYG